MGSCGGSPRWRRSGGVTSGVLVPSGALPAAFGRGHPLGRRDSIGRPPNYRRPANLRIPPSADARALTREATRPGCTRPTNAPTEPSRPRAGPGQRGPDRPPPGGGWSDGVWGVHCCQRAVNALVHCRAGSVPGGGACGRSKRLAAVSRGSQRVSPLANDAGNAHGQGRDRPQWRRPRSKCTVQSCDSKDSSA